MYDREAFEIVATDIAQWESDALQLPLADLERHDGQLPARA